MAKGIQFTTAGTPALPAAGTVRLYANVSGDLVVKDRNGSDRTLAFTADASNSQIDAIPAGVIVLWSGSSSSIPTGWLLCNGTNDTPDLRDKFVLGAGSSYLAGATGGSADATLVSHTHIATVIDPGHAHRGSTSSGGIMATQIGTNSTATSADTATTGITVENSTEGSSATGANMPPYYALCYIMKV